MESIAEVQTGTAAKAHAEEVRREGELLAPGFWRTVVGPQLRLEKR